MFKKLFLIVFSLSVSSCFADFTDVGQEFARDYAIERDEIVSRFEWSFTGYKLNLQNILLTLSDRYVLFKDKTCKVLHYDLDLDLLSAKHKLGNWKADWETNFNKQPGDLGIIGQALEPEITQLETIITTYETEYTTLQQQFLNIVARQNYLIVGVTALSTIPLYIVGKHLAKKKNLPCYHTYIFTLIGTGIIAQIVNFACNQYLQNTFTFPGN